MKLKRVLYQHVTFFLHQNECRYGFSSAFGEGWVYLALVLDRRFDQKWSQSNEREAVAPDSPKEP